MNTKDLNRHIGVDVGSEDKSMMAYGYTDEGVMHVDGVIDLGTLTEAEYETFVHIWSDHSVHNDTIDAWIYNLRSSKAKHEAQMKKMRTIAIVWIVVGIPLLLAALVWLYASVK